MAASLVIDVVNLHVFQYIKDFKVIDRDDSDHFPVSCVFELPYRSNTIVNNINDYPLNTWKKF